MSALPAKPAPTPPESTFTPELTFPEHLPVSARREDIAAALNAYQVVIVCGETGSGKTTQLPKIVLMAGRGVKGKVGMTQPRRIAAKSVANRLAEETKTRLGGFIGWQVRFTDQVGPDTRIKVMTDGILLAETQSDPEFRAYDTLILDEAHERSLNIDFLLGYLKTLLPRRPELKLIISSATLEADRFSEYFNGAPVVEVSGRTYPVEMRYRAEQAVSNKPADPTKKEAPDPNEEPDIAALLVHAVDELAAEGPGDILVFLPGEREIRDAQESLRKHHPAHTEILPLFARLSVSEQEEVFRPHSGRRIVLATNVAETSLTVPGIHYVVDAGLARVKRYSIRNKIEQLKIEKVSQASANQRAGRCGRVADGICIRLYEEQDFLARPKYTTPELLRSSLAGVILRMKSLRLPEIENFPFLDAPEPKRIRDGQQLLVELGALDERGRLTGIGKQLAHLPLDPRIGRMLIAARDKACLHEVLVIAAALTSQDPRERPLEHQAASDQKHARFADPNSDFIALLKLWHYLDEQNAHRKSQRKLREGLKAEYLSPLRVREWRDVYGQLATQVKELGWRVEDEWHPTQTVGRVSPTGVTRQAKDAETHVGLRCANPTYEGHAGDLQAEFNAQLNTRYSVIHQALLPGLLGNLGFLTEDGVYLGAREVKFLIFPGSGVKKKPKWLMGAEIVETKRVYARTVAKIEPEWVEHAARHLLKLSYSDPHWAKKPAHVAASLRATLYGLPIVNGRKVHYGPIDPTLSRELFIRGALVNGDFETRAPWFVHNQRLLEEIDDLTHRSRNARIAVDEAAIYQFFDTRIPADMHNGAAFEKWRRESERNNPKLLFLQREDLLSGDTQASARDFPPNIEFNGVRFALTYRFDPGTPDDGVTLEAPLAALNQIPVLACEWLVPGLLEEKITALIKSLPQSIRRAFVPVPEYSRAATQALLEGKKTGALTDALAAFLSKTTGTLIPRDAWRPEALPSHLNMHFRVQDERGKTLAEGRDLGTLRQQLGAEARQELARSAGQFERDNVTRWDFGDLPESMHVATHGKPNVAAFPALEHVAGQVRLALFDSAETAEVAHREGVARLLWLGFPDLLRQNERDLGQKLKAASLQYGLLFKGAPGFSNPAESLLRDVLNAAALDVLDFDKPRHPQEVRQIRKTAEPPMTLLPRNQNDFENAAKAARSHLPEAVLRITQIALEVLAAALKIEQTLTKAPPAWKAAVVDMRSQLAELVFPGFMARHPANRLAHLPRYLKAMEMRLNKLSAQTARDLGAMNEMARLLAAWRQRRERLAAQGRVGGSIEPEMEGFRWRLEELRVSLFAQELRTPEPVSVKRLEKRWAEIAGI